MSLPEREARTKIKFVTGYCLQKQYIPSIRVVSRGLLFCFMNRVWGIVLESERPSFRFELPLNGRPHERDEED